MSKNVRSQEEQFIILNLFTLLLVLMESVKRYTIHSKSDTSLDSEFLSSIYDTLYIKNKRLFERTVLRISESF